MIAIKNYKNEIKEHVLIIVLFLVLTLVLTYPVITRVVTHAAGDGGDGFQFKWNIWHVNRVLTEGGGIREIYHTDYQYYPAGTSLTFSTLSLTNTLFFAFPLTLITNNLVLIYNILFFLTFILAGYGMYLLVRYLVGNKIIAFLTGFAYTFSPLHMTWGLGYLNLMSIHWTPFFFLFFFKMFEEREMRNVTIAVIFLFFLALADWHHLVFAFLIAAPYFAYKFITTPYLFTKYFFLRTVVFLFLFIVIILPFMVPMISEYLEAGKDYYTRPLLKTIAPINYILPSILNPFWGKEVKELYPFSGPIKAFIEKIVFLGYLVLFLSLFYLVKIRKHLFWLFVALLFFGLSLASNDKELGSFINSLFVFNIIRMPARFSFGVLFSLLIIFSFALRDFWSMWESKIKERFAFSGKRARIVLGTTLFVILTVEYITVPYPTTHEYRKLEIGAAREVGQVLQGPHPVLGDDFIVLTLPTSFSFYAGQIDLYFQTFHRKRITGGYVGLASPGSRQYLNELTNIVEKAEADKFQEFFTDYRVGYIIFYSGVLKNYLGAPEITDGKIISLLEKIPIKQVARYRHIYIFQVFPELISEKD